MATRKEVAQLAGVSEATVSRVLNGVGPIKESTRKRVLAAAQQLNYHLNAAAASLARGKSGILGVVLPHVPKVHLFSTYYFSEILSGVGEAVRSRGFSLLLLYRDAGEVYDYVSHFRTKRIDACIVLGASTLDNELAGIRRAAVEELPFCLMDQKLEQLRVSTVSADHEAGAYEATRHLLAKGHKRIGFLNGSPQYSNSMDRLRGYCRAIQEAGMAIDETLMYSGNYSRKSGYEASAAVFSDLPKLDAVFASNDRMAIGLIQGLRERGCELPADLPIVGYDDSDAAGISDPPLTTVRVPFYDMGQLAAERLLDRLPEWRSSESVFFEKLQTRLIVRKSCGT